MVQVLLRPSADELRRRVYERGVRGGHFMPPELLDSQLETLEVDPDAMVFGKFRKQNLNLALNSAEHADASHSAQYAGSMPPDEIVKQILLARNHIPTEQQ